MFALRGSRAIDGFAEIVRVSMGSCCMCQERVQIARRRGLRAVGTDGCHVGWVCVRRGDGRGEETEGTVLRAEGLGGGRDGIGRNALLLSLYSGQRVKGSAAPPCVS